MKQSQLTIIALAGLLFGGYFAVEEWFIEPIFATNDAMMWTLPLVVYIFLALASTGCSIIYALGSLYQIDEIEKHKMPLLCLALALLIGAFVALSTEMGSPLSIIWFLFSPNIVSPIWWMGMLYGIELVLLTYKIIMDARGIKISIDKQVTILTLIIAASAAIVLGSVFGTIIGRESYVGMDASIMTLLSAIASGIAILYLVGIATQEKVFSKVAQWAFALIMLFVIVQYVYLQRSSIVTEIDWIPILLVVSFVVAFALTFVQLRIASLIMLISVFLLESLFVIQGQMIVLGPQTVWFGDMVFYAPNLPEIAILILGISVAILTNRLLEMGIKRIQSAK